MLIRQPCFPRFLGCMILLRLIPSFTLLGLSDTISHSFLVPTVLKATRQFGRSYTPHGLPQVWILFMSLVMPSMEIAPMPMTPTVGLTIQFILMYFPRQAASRQLRLRVPYKFTLTRLPTKFLSTMGFHPTW